ncbi:hypothetical protein B7494_g148 [Chlorociboria aeruginascens]|nr:hypothetical protein B7494_g148 [Chlorociboria aeruginascens]
MVTKTSSRLSPRSSHGHSHSLSHSQSQSHRKSSRISTTPIAAPTRLPPSVGQALAPHDAGALRSPNIEGGAARTPSPSYFGLVADSTADPLDSAQGPKDNWSPPTSSLLSFGAASPMRLVIDSNPDFEAFRKQTETHNAFSLGHGNLSHFASSPALPPTRQNPELSRPGMEKHDTPPSPRLVSRLAGLDSTRIDVDDGRDSAYVSSSHTSQSSMNAPTFFDRPRQTSPANITPTLPPPQRNVLSHVDDKHPRLSLPQNRLDPSSPYRGGHARADTLPSSLEDGPNMISPEQLKDLLKHQSSSHFLLLDLRVFPQFSQSRIQGALNLCIPTTLLKRPSFNLQKLQDTFSNDSEKLKFSKWKEAKYIVVYDAFSSEKKDAISAINTLKKFTNEAWKGHGYILRGGFQEFSKTYAKLIDNRSTQDMQSSKINLSLGTLMPNAAPVAGGCMMPATENAANPFFGNIRQNQELVDGVGQMEIKSPEDFVHDNSIPLPRWLMKASAKEDHGKTVSEKFLRLELDEQSRMSKALSAGVNYGSPKPGSAEVQIAGIEKGGKNRYNNIWPFEHARVRLQGRPEGACDYVNASHVKASRSNKRYIASQGPLPATFEDFWTVIWEQDVRVIVMLTAETEGGQLKCHPYWSNGEYGPVKVKALSEKKMSLDPTKHRNSIDHHDHGRRRANTSNNTALSASALTSNSILSSYPLETPHVIVRKFSLSHAAHPFSPIREITQVHYSSWPDFGAPAKPSELLRLIELSNAMQRSASSATKSTRSEDPENDQAVRPMLVHCSAGCGRTGTFCTIDSVIDMLKRQRKDISSGVAPMDTAPIGGDYMSQGKDSSEPDQDWIFDQDLDLVQKTVEDFRGQRLSMVQSLRQYCLCYETILEWISQQYLGSGSRPSRERSGSDGGYSQRSSS